MSRRISAIHITSAGVPLGFVGPGQSLNLTATPVVTGTGPSIDTSVHWFGATPTGTNTATFTASGTISGQRLFVVQAFAAWLSSSIVNVTADTATDEDDNTFLTGLSSVSWVSGDDLGNWSPLTQVIIDGLTYTIAAGASGTSAKIFGEVNLSGASVVLRALSGQCWIGLGPVSVLIRSTTYGERLPAIIFREPHQFYATVAGSSNQDVTWSCDEGSITSDGLWTPPSNPTFKVGVVLAGARIWAVAAADGVTRGHRFVNLR